LTLIGVEHEALEQRVEAQGVGAQVGEGRLMLKGERERLALGLGMRRPSPT